MDVFFRDDLARIFNALEATASDMAEDAERIGYMKALDAMRLAIGAAVPAHDVVRRAVRQVDGVVRSAVRVLPVLFLLACGTLLSACAETDAPASDVTATVRAVATASAITQRAELEAAQHARDVSQAAVLSWLAFGVEVVLLLGLGLVALLALFNVQRHFARRLRLSEVRLELLANVVETRAGTMATAGAGVRPVLSSGVVPDLLEASEASDAPALEPDTMLVHHRNGKTEVMLKAHDARPDAVRLACRLVRLSMAANGASSDRLATWRQLQLSSDTWTRAVRLLGAHVETRPGRNGGTRLRNGQTLATFYSALASGRIALEDAPRR